MEIGEDSRIILGGLMKNILLTATLLLSTVGLVLGQSPLVGQYSADHTMMIMGRTIQGKTYVDQGKTRIEIAMAGTQVASIIRPDKKLVYVIMPAQKMVMEMPLNLENQVLTSAHDKNANREKVGTETINGQVCDKYKITSEGTVVYLWANKSTSVPVQLQSADQKVKVEWTNVKVGAQPASLFEPPADYKKMSGPSLGNE